MQQTERSSEELHKMKGLYRQREQEQGSYTRQKADWYSKAIFLPGMAWVYWASLVPARSFLIDWFKIPLLGGLKLYLCYVSVWWCGA